MIGYTIGGATFDPLVFGYYEGDKLMYAARTRNGFASALRADLMKKFKRSKPRNVRSGICRRRKAGRWGRWTHSGQDGGLLLAEAGAVGQFE